MAGLPGVGLFKDEPGSVGRIPPIHEPARNPLFTHVQITHKKDSSVYTNVRVVFKKEDTHA